VTTGRAVAVAMRFVTYNIRHARGADLRLSTSRVADTLRALGPDAIGLQEVWRRDDGTDQAPEIAEPLGMDWRYLEAHRRGGKGLGNAVLTRGSILGSADIELARRREARGALVADIELDGVRFVFVSTHLSLNRETRAQQMSQLVRIVAERPRDLPLVLTGDFNATSDELAPLAEVLTVVDSPPATFPSPWPVRSIDHIAFSAHWRLAELFSSPGLASDHRPLVADLELLSP
jgi:endonuclease/exonuclease/phosphatase family metal-dependent hydrolase